MERMRGAGSAENGDPADRRGIRFRSNDAAAESSPAREIVTNYLPMRSVRG